MKNLPKIVLYAISALCVITTILVGLGDNDSMLYLTYVLTVIAIIMAIASGVYSSTLNPGGLKQSLIGLGFFGVIALVSYLFSSDEVLPMYGNIGAGEARFVDVQLISMYILCIVSIVAMIYSSVVKLIK